MAAQRSPSKDEDLKVVVSLDKIAEELTADTENSQRIRNQIVTLFQELHGTKYAIDSDEVAEVFEIFVGARSIAPKGRLKSCSIGMDGMFYEDNLTQEEIDTFRYVQPGTDWFSEDWNSRSVFDDVFLADPHGTKYAWTAVMMFMLSHYSYLHE